MDKLKQYSSGNMKDEDMEKITERLINQKFDKEKKDAWKQLLKEQYGIEKEALPQTSNNIVFIRRLVAVAAALGLLISAFFLFRSPQPTYQQLADNYIEELPIMADQLVFRKGQFQEEATRISANEAYIKQNFEAAIGYWEELITNNTANNYDRFYLGVSYLRQKISQPNQAIDLLLQSKEQVPSLEQETNWILSLAYIRAGDVNNARTLLQSIVSEQAYMAEKAQELLDELSNE
jgi:hypothetical protein